MPTFTYKAMDPQLRFITGEIEAGSLREVSSELEKPLTSDHTVLRDSRPSEKANRANCQGLLRWSGPELRPRSSWLAPQSVGS